MYIYQASLWCDDCGDEIKRMLDCADRDDSFDDDSEHYPQWGSDDSESDCPEHCDGCGKFLGNSLTSDGVDYVVSTVRDDLEEGRVDSIACTVWKPFYFWLDFPNFDFCPVCGNWGELFENDDCVDVCDVCLSMEDCIDADECSGPEFVGCCTD